MTNNTPSTTTGPSLFFRAIGYMLMFLAIQVLAQTLVLVVTMLVTHQQIEELDAIGTIISLIVSSLTAIGLFVGLKWSPVARSYVRSRPWAVLCWCVVASLGTIIPSLYLQEQIPPMPDWMEDMSSQTDTLFREIISTRGGYLVIALLAPVAEELVFRGAVLRTLLRWQPQRRWLMIALSALLFALGHLNPGQMPHAFLIGLLLGWLYMRTKSVVPGIAYHWVNNTVAYVLMKLYPDPSIGLSDILGGSSKVLLAVAFSLCILLPALYQLHQRMRDASGNGLAEDKPTA